MKVKSIISALILCGVFQQYLQAAEKDKAAQPTTPPPASKSGPTLITPEQAWKMGLLTDYQLEEIHCAQRARILNNALNTPPK